MRSAMAVFFVLLAVPAVAFGDRGLTFRGTYEPFVWPPRAISDFALAADGTLVVTSFDSVSLHAHTQSDCLVPGSIAVADPISGGVFVGGTHSPLALELLVPNPSWMGGNHYSEDIGASRLLTLSPDGNTLYGSSADEDQIVVFSRLAGSAQFMPFEEQTNSSCGVESLGDVTSLAVAPFSLGAVAGGESVRRPLEHRRLCGRG
jgi:hypothetical protein